MAQAADNTYTDAMPTSPNNDLLTPGVWERSLQNTQVIFESPVWVNLSP